MAEQAQRDSDDANKEKIKLKMNKKAMLKKVTKIIKRVKAKIDLIFEENTEPAVKRSSRPTIGDRSHIMPQCLRDTCDAPESLLGFPSIPKMSASVFRTSDRSTNGSSDVSVGGEKNETKKEENQNVTNQN